MPIIVVKLEASDANAPRIDAAFGSRTNLQKEAANFITERVAQYEAEIALKQAKQSNESLVINEAKAQSDAYRKAKAEITIT